jgi:hypothetical protein
VYIKKIVKADNIVEILKYNPIKPQDRFQLITQLKYSKHDANMKLTTTSTFLALGLSLCQGVPLPGGEPTKPPRASSAPGATRATARFGPFTLPSSSKNGPMGLTGGLMQSQQNVEMPCKGCTYTYIKAEMVYKDGTKADRANGAYMHHITLNNLAAHPSQGATLPIAAAPFYLIGNERLPIVFPQAGVYLTKNASIVLDVLLQNLEVAESQVYLDMDYDYLQGQPAGYSDITPVPQDALGLGAILGTTKQTGAWEKTSSKYTVHEDARILMMYGHVHDGGLHTEILVNGKVVCDSVAYYGDMKVPPGQLTTAPTHMHGDMRRKRDDPKTNSHISAFGECVNIGTVNKGDNITTKVYYDFNQRAATPMANGKQDGLMGISMTYLGLPMPKDS